MSWVHVSVGISMSTACSVAQTLRDSRWFSLCLEHGRFEDPSNLVFKFIICAVFDLRLH